MKKEERFIDLSDIKDNDLDKTASFTDLMSRSQRKLREKEKKQATLEKNNDLEKPTDDILNIINESSNKETNINNELSVETPSDIESLNKTTQLNNIEYNTNVDDSIEEEFENKGKYGSGYIIIIGLFLILSIVYFLYSIYYTDILDRNKFLLIDSTILLSMTFLFGISLIGSKKVSKVFSILNYIVLVGFIAFNVLLTLNYIK